MLETPPARSKVSEPAAAPRPRRRRVKARLRTALVVTHRWSSLVLGLLLLVVVLSGVVLLYEQEIDRVVHPDLHRTTESADPISHTEALAVVRRELPSFKAADVVDSHGVYLIYDEHEHHAYVDPGSGRFLGTRDTRDGMVGFMANLHLCALSCAGYPGHIAFLEKPADILGNDELTVGGLILAVSGLFLLLLVITGFVVWWPGIKRMARGLRLRRGRGAYAFNYDIHNLIGLAALPFLFMWAFTGAHFELKQFSELWYAVLPGTAVQEREVTSKPVPGSRCRWTRPR